jgi:hypothetical protein
MVAASWTSCQQKAHASGDAGTLRLFFPEEKEI